MPGAPAKGGGSISPDPPLCWCGSEDKAGDSSGEKKPVLLATELFPSAEKTLAGVIAGDSPGVCSPASCGWLYAGLLPICPGAHIVPPGICSGLTMGICELTPGMAKLPELAGVKMPY